MSKKKLLSDREFLEHLIEVFTEVSGRDDETLDRALKEEGFDPDQLVSEGLALVSSLSRDQRLARARAKRDSLLARIHHIRQVAVEKTIPARQLKEEITQLLIGRGLGQEAVQAFFHRFESVEQEDLQGLLEDDQILDILEELREEESE